MKNYILFLTFNIISLVSCNFEKNTKTMETSLGFLENDNIIFYLNDKETVLTKNVFDSMQEIRKDYDKFKSGNNYLNLNKNQKIKAQHYIQSMFFICKENSLDLFKTINLLKYHFTADALYDLSVENFCLESIRKNILDKYNITYEKVVNIHENESSSTIKKFAKELSFAILSDMNYFESNEITDVEVYFSILKSYEKLLSVCLEKEKTLSIVIKLFDMCLHEYVREIVEQLNNFQNRKIETYIKTTIKSKIKSSFIEDFDFFRTEDENNWNNKANYRQNMEESQIKMLNILFSAICRQEDRSNLSYLSKHLLNSEYIRTSVLGKNEKINFDEIFNRDCEPKLNLKTNSLIIKKESELEFILKTFRSKDKLENIILHKDLQSKVKPKKKKKKIVLNQQFTEEKKTTEDVEEYEEEKEKEIEKFEKIELLEEVKIPENLINPTKDESNSKYDFVVNFINERPKTMTFKDVETILRILDIEIRGGKGSHLKLVYTNKSNQIITRGLFKLHNKDSYGAWAIKFLMEIAKERLDDLSL